MPSEFPFIVDFEKTKGLRPRREMRYSKQYLHTAKNVKSSELGLEKPPTIQQLPDPGAPGFSAATWPFPQIVDTFDETLIASGDEIRPFIFDVTTMGTTLSMVTDPPLSFSLAQRPETGVAVPGVGNHLQLADFGEKTWFIATGDDFFISTPKYRDSSNRYILVTGPTPAESEGSAVLVAGSTIRAAAAINNRLYLGGITPSSTLTNLFTGDWIYSGARGLLDHWKESVGGGTFHEELAFGENWILWSEAGDDNLNWPFQLIISLLTPLASDSAADVAKYTTIERNILDAITEGRIGFMPMRWNGTVQVIKQLGSSIIVYGTNGITAISSDGIRNEMLLHGVKGRGAVAGTLSEHTFVDVYGNIWRIDSNLTLTKLNYVEQINPLLSTNLRVIHNELLDDYYISDGLTGYLLSRTGLTQVEVMPTSLIPPIPFIEASIATGVLDGTDSGMQIVLDNMDMGVSDLKQYNSAELIYNEISNVTMTPKLKYNNSSRSLTQLSARYGGPEGLFHIGAKALDLRLQIDGTLDSRRSALKRLTVRYQYASNRSVRGPRGGEGSAGLSGL